jgi:hypothetical protein
MLLYRHSCMLAEALAHGLFRPHIKQLNNLVLIVIVVD